MSRICNIGNYNAVVLDFNINFGPFIPSVFITYPFWNRYIVLPTNWIDLYCREIFCAIFLHTSDLYSCFYIAKKIFETI